MEGRAAASQTAAEMHGMEARRCRLCGCAERARRRGVSACMDVRRAKQRCCGSACVNGSATMPPARMRGMGAAAVAELLGDVMSAPARACGAFAGWLSENVRDGRAGQNAAASVARRAAGRDAAASKTDAAAGKQLRTGRRRRAGRGERTRWANWGAAGVCTAVPAGLRHDFGAAVAAVGRRAKFQWAHVRPETEEMRCNCNVTLTATCAARYWRAISPAR